ncbi:MAG: hypothetical protein ACOCV4_09180 [Myxococcota bacterium]
MTSASPWARWLVFFGALAAVTAPVGAAASDPSAPQVRFLDARNRPLSPDRHALGVSHAMTNDATLPRERSPRGNSPDPENFRIEVRHPRDAEIPATVDLVSVDPESGTTRASLRRVPLVRVEPGIHRTPWLRLVSDRIDALAPGVENRVLRVALRDVVHARGGALRAHMPVGRPGPEGGPRAALRGRLRIRVLRLQPGGPPVIGRNEGDALRIAREQVAIANEIWLQCFVDFGKPADADVAVVDPPPPALVAIGEGNGLPAAGGGIVRFRVDDEAIEPVPTRAGHPPVLTALAVAKAVRAAGFEARVTENLPTEFGEGRSADVLVRRRDGRLATITADGDAPLGTDARQSVHIGSVDLTDGLHEFRNMTAGTGTLEERTLLKTLLDDDPTTIDLMVVNGFAAGTRQGEAFIEREGGPLVNALLLDRDGLRHQRSAWTQAHETGHVLLDNPYHPDQLGPDRPWLLMDGDTSLPRVTGPKRLTEAECRRARHRSGADALPSLLAPRDRR